MNGEDGDNRTKELIFEYQLDAPPEKVWRAEPCGIPQKMAARWHARRSRAGFVGAGPRDHLPDAG